MYDNVQRKFTNKEDGMQIVYINAVNTKLTHNCEWRLIMNEKNEYTKNIKKKEKKKKNEK